MKYLKLFIDQSEIFNSLPDEEAGQLIKAVFAYMNGNDVELEGMLNAVFVPIRQGLDRSIEEYENVVIRNQENGKKGGRPSLENKPKKPTGLSGLAKKPKKSQDEDEDEDEEEKLAAAEIFSIKGEKASINGGRLYVNGNLINNPVSYLEAIKHNQTHEPTPRAAYLRPAKDMTDLELLENLNGKKPGRDEGIDADVLYEAIERGIYNS